MDSSIIVEDTEQKRKRTLSLLLSMWSTWRGLEVGWIVNGCGFVSRMLELQTGIGLKLLSAKSRSSANQFIAICCSTVKSQKYSIYLDRYHEVSSSISRHDR